MNSLTHAKDMLFIRYSICCIFPLLRRIGASDPRILWLDSVQNRNVFCQNMLLSFYAITASILIGALMYYKVNCHALWMFWSLSLKPSCQVTMPSANCFILKETALTLIM
ncbi:hypothetical protein BDE02_10G133900 [Populus trichocarpa]|uniref:Uncharacterized protein n=1 Tax=Populus trichocarpa TaxID=3694 RepID=A0A2K1YU85_POPTR|nr:hypothetical protein BDE02_10G133900 [Populus trichocarpa]